MVVFHEQNADWKGALQYIQCAMPCYTFISQRTPPTPKAEIIAILSAFYVNIVPM